MSKKNKLKELRAEIGNAITVQLEKLAGRYGFGSKKTSKNIGRAAKNMAKKFSSRVKEKTESAAPAAPIAAIKPVPAAPKPAARRAPASRRKPAATTKPVTTAKPAAAVKAAQPENEKSPA